MAGRTKTATTTGSKTNGKPKPGGTDARRPKPKSVIVRMNRRDLVAAKYNPRQIDAVARRKLRQSIQRFGLIEPPVWNKRTGNLVGGHQRLDALDQIEGTDDYELDVSVVDVDEKTEREMNVALNNPAMQGFYDVPLLDDLIKSGQFDFENAGFERIDIEMLYQDAGLTPDFLESITTPQDDGETDRAVEQIDTVLDEADAVKREQAEREKIAGIKERREKYEQRTREDKELDFHVTVVFRTNAEKHAFMRALEMGENDAYLDGGLIAERLGIDVSSGASSDDTSNPSPTGSTQ